MDHKLNYLIKNFCLFDDNRQDILSTLTNYSKYQYYAFNLNIDYVGTREFLSTQVESHLFRNENVQCPQFNKESFEKKMVAYISNKIEVENKENTCSISNIQSRKIPNNMLESLFPQYSIKLNKLSKQLSNQLFFFSDNILLLSLNENLFIPILYLPFIPEFLHLIPNDSVIRLHNFLGFKTLYFSLGIIQTNH